MTKLISKVQYRNFEPGEFIEVKERNYEETIQLIESFPWSSQREHIVIDLTNPSITIEGTSDFLKIALFFNQTFVIHYFSETQVLFTKSFSDLRDGYKYIKNYFEDLPFDTTDFKKETTWFQHNLKHFVTQEFRYLLTAKSVRKYLTNTSGMNFILSIFIIISIIKEYNKFSPLVVLLFLFVSFLMGGGINLILFFNYYKNARDKILIMSKGNDVFYFGNQENPSRYSKSDILKFIKFQPRSDRNPVNGFGFIEIQFKDGTNLRIPNLLISISDMENKLTGYPMEQKNKFPYIKS